MPKPVRFWVLTNPRSSSSEVGDILFESTVKGIMLQALGGLSPDDVIGVFHEGDEQLAREKAIQMMDLYSQMKKLSAT